MSATTRRLLGFALLSSGLVTAALVALGEPSVWDELRHLAAARQGVDSWHPMCIARGQLAEDGGAPLYAELFFERRIKFLYPPTALLPLDLLPGDPRGVTQDLLAKLPALNAISWLCVALAAVFSLLVFDRALERSRYAARDRRDRALRAGVALAMAVTFYPMVKAYSLGQMQVVVNALFAVAVWCWVGERRAASGVLVALMAAIKPQYALIGLWGLLRGERRFVVAALSAGSLLLLVSVLRFGFEHHWDYLSVVSHVSRHGEAYWPNQTVGGFLHRLLGNGVSSHWDPRVYPPYHPVVHAGSLLASLLLLGAAFLWPLREPVRGSGLDFAAAALATTLASPLAWEHHYGVLLPMFALLLPAVLERGGAGMLAGLAGAWLVSAHYWDALRRIDGTVWNPLQSLLLFAALYLLGLLLVIRARPDSASNAVSAPAASPPSVRHS